MCALVQIDVAQIGLERAEALREVCVRVLVGELGRDDDLLALFPVDRGRDRLRVGELEAVDRADDLGEVAPGARRIGSEENTSELKSLMRLSYAVCCLKKKK